MPDTGVPTSGDLEVSLDPTPAGPAARPDVASIGPYRLMKKLGEGGMGQVSKDIDTGLAKDPELQAEMMSVMGKVYLSLGL
jgi:hypothetical protein